MPHPSNYSAIDLFVRRLSTHSVLSSAECDAIRDLPRTSMDIRAHIDFLRAGEVATHASIVSEGLVGQFGQTEDGKRQFVSIHVPGEMVNLPSVMTPRATTSLNALAVSTVEKIPHESLRALTCSYPAIASAFWRDCIIDSRIVAQWLVNVGRRDARSRIAHFLCEVGTRYRMLDQSDGQSFRLQMSQEQLGDALGLTSVHINRMLMTLRADKLVAFDRNYVQILDPQALVRTGEFDPGYLSDAGAAVH